MTRTIELTVAPDGQTTLETKGFQGAECQSASRFLEMVLGQKYSGHLKPDYYSTNHNQENVQNQTGASS